MAWSGFGPGKESLDVFTEDDGSVPDGYGIININGKVVRFALKEVAVETNAGEIVTMIAKGYVMFASDDRNSASSKEQPDRAFDFRGKE